MNRIFYWGVGKMIRLENVSTIRLMEYIDFLSYQNSLYQRVQPVLLKNHIDNFLQLKELLESDEIENQWIYQVLQDYLNNVINRMNKANEKGLGLEIFMDNNYKESLIDRKTLELTDRENMGNVLLYTIPYISSGVKKSCVEHLSIEQIKYYLSYVDDVYFRNLFFKNRNFGVVATKRVLEVINFYEEQVLRQAKETDERDINLFMLNKTYKDEIIEDEVRYIAEYLVDNALVCIWGKMTDLQKKKLISCTTSSRGKNLKNDRRALVNAISNYTTLNEIKDGVIKSRVLDRFIVK